MALVFKLAHCFNCNFFIVVTCWGRCLLGQGKLWAGEVALGPGWVSSTSLLLEKEEESR